MSSKQKTNQVDMDNKLNENNYLLWHKEATIIFEDENLVDKQKQPGPNDDPFCIKDSARAQRIIFSNVSKNIQSQLVNLKSAPEMWNYTYREFSGTNKFRKNQGIKKLATATYDSSMTLDDNLLELESTIIATETASGSKSISIVELGIHMFLNCLPERFSNCRTILDTQPQEVTLSLLKSTLKEENERHKERSERSDDQTPPFIGLANTKCQHGRQMKRCWNCNPELHPSKQTCKDCNKKGHYSRNSRLCEQHDSKRKAFGIKRSSEEDSFPPEKAIKFDSYTHGDDDLRSKIIKNKAFSVSNQNRTDVLVFDSGCSQSIIQNKDKLKNYTLCNSTFTVANSGSLHTIGKGDFQINQDLIIKDVLHCPDIAMNLISISQLCKQGYTTETNNKQMTVKRDMKVILKAPHSNGLYEFILPKVLAAKSGSNSLILHKRLGHLNFQSLKLLSHLSTGLTLDGDPAEKCQTCILAKTIRATYNNSESRAGAIGELTHCDLCHVGPPTIVENATMFLALTDDHARYTTIYLLRHKDDTFDCIKSYNQNMKNKTGKSLHIIRSDGGGEFKNSRMDHFCKEEGILQQYSTPYTPEQNSRAERNNRTILEITRALLIESGLNQSFWGLAAESAVYLVGVRSGKKRAENEVDQQFYS
jgi:hypothetical protein